MPLDAQPEILHSTCPHDCPSCCALEVEKLDPNTIGRVRGAKDNSYTDGVICAKVARYAERVHHPDRLKTPLRRIGEKGCGPEGFEPISWEDALDIVADNFQRAEDRFGSETVWPYQYAGTMGLVQRDGIHRLRHAKKYSRQHDTICSSLANAGWRAGAGVNRGVDCREMEHSDQIVMWGGNPVSTQVNVMHHITQAKKGRGAKLVVVDPYRTATAEQADLHVMLQPGTDAALACAMMHVMFRDGLADRAYLEKYTDVPAELEAHLAGRTPEWAAEITGLSAQEIVDFAHQYGGIDRTFLRIGYGFTRSRNGAANMHAVSCLPAVTGQWQYRGGGALFTQYSIYNIDYRLITGSEMLDRDTRLMDMSRIGPILTGDPYDLGDGPPVTAMLIQNTNPAVVAPETSKVREGFARDDLFVCVHEQFLTDTARMADIVLPATTFLEHHDMYQAGGHTHLQVTKPVIEPQHEARPNHFVICELAKRLGAEHRSFQMTEWEIIDETLRASGHPGADEVHAMHWLDCAPDFSTQHFLGGFGTDDGRFHFRADWDKVGFIEPERMPPLPDHMDVIDNPDAEHPFRLVAAPARNYLNSSFTETPTSQKREGRPEVLMHPVDCAELEIAHGDMVALGNGRGEVLLHARPFDGIQRAVVVVESIWPNRAFEGGRGINTLISADQGPPLGGAVFHDTKVWIRPASAV